jgi:A/G-specific adenine glycosylase
MRSSVSNDLNFARVLLDWFDLHGRHDLPWQHPRTAYQVWVSEIMLQQTQVQTVIPYFQRFMKAFPTIETLAQAEQTDVLAHWAGLGYYARGRNLHRAAQQIQQQYQGCFPTNYQDIIDLPGIGRSTAGAILAQAFEQPYAILDGNVKRVLTRFYGIEGWPGDKRIENQLWQKAEALLPSQRLADYTQALMDFGATLCKRSQPVCEACPLREQCQAIKTQSVKLLPTPKPKKTLPIKECWVLILQDELGRIAVERRPQQGIWGGLYSLPEFSDINQLMLAGVKPDSLLEWQMLRHSFSHYHLHIHPIQAQKALVVGEVCDRHIWLSPQQALSKGLPAPIKKIITQMESACQVSGLHNSIAITYGENT